MEKTLALLGDGIAIAALSIIASVSLSAWKAIVPDAKVPLQFRRDGTPGFRASKPIAVLFMPVASTILLFLPVIAQIPQHAQTPGDAGTLFFIRSALAAALAFAHIVHMKQVMQVMAQEGQLRS